ncbi:MAG: DUF4238 domain-containing protein [Candidatus Thorarchaeota archaeon]
MSKQIKRRQHIIPQFYLKSFAVQTKPNLYKIYCYFKQQKNKIKRLGVKNVAVKSFFYDDDKFPQPIETYLSFTEKDLSKTYHKIIKEKSIKNLSKKERSHIVYLTYIQYVRTEYMRTKIIQIFKDLLEKEKSKYLVNHSIDEWNDFNEFGITKHPIRLQKLLIVVNNEYLEYWRGKIDDSLLRIINIMLKVKNKILNKLFNSKQILLEIKSDNLEFYTCDHPILFYSKRSIQDDEGLTFLNIYDSYTQIYYPLSPKLCLNFYDSKIFYDYEKKFSNLKKELYKSDINDIALINKLATHEAYRMIFSKSGRFNIAQKYLDQNSKFRELNQRRFYKI